MIGAKDKVKSNWILLAFAVASSASGPVFAQAGADANADARPTANSQSAPPPPVNFESVDPRSEPARDIGLPPPAPPPAPTPSLPPPFRVSPAPPPAPVPVRYPRRAFLKNRLEASPTQADYPASAWRAGQEGRVSYSVAVDKEGKPSSCAVSRSSGSVALDKATCEIMMSRANFRPAYKAAGKPVTGTFASSMTWSKIGPLHPAIEVTTQYLMTAEGVIEDCKLLKLEGDVDPELREIMTRRAENGQHCGPDGRRYRNPYRDENGVPVAKQVIVRYSVELSDPAVSHEQRD